jgi:ribosome-binding factor A
MTQSQRQLRVGEIARHALIESIQRGEFYEAPILNKTFITIPEVRMSPDLKIATAYINTLNGKGVKEIIKALAANKHFLRMEMAKRLHLKYAADLRFRPDETLEEAARIDALLKGV